MMADRLSAPLFSTRTSTPMNDVTNQLFCRDDAMLGSVRHSDSLLSLKRSESALSRFPKVEANISKDDSLKLYRIQRRIQKEPHRVISIEESPIMLLPKARLRNDYDPSSVRRSFSVIPQDDYTSLHLSTVPFAPSEATTPRSLSRISLKSRTRSRSGSDSGFGSFRRCVTFDELSIGLSTVSKSLDDIERESEFTDPAKEADDIDFVLEHHVADDSGVDVPDYIDNYADDVFTVPVPPKVAKTSKRDCKLTENDIERCHQRNCQICSGFMNERERIQRYFGGIDQFLDWLYSRWGRKVSVGLEGGGS